VVKRAGRAWAGAATGSEPFEVSGLPDATVPIRLDVHFLAPDSLSVISDIDDTIRASHVHARSALLRGTFVDPFQAVHGMADVYRAWSRGGAQFHYVSATPWQLDVPIAAFLEAQAFPKGSFHLRDFRWRDRSFFSVLRSPHRYKLRSIEPLLQRLPRRRFVLIGDSGQQDPRSIRRAGAPIPASDSTHLHPRRRSIDDGPIPWRVRRCRSEIVGRFHRSGVAANRTAD
jgi:hypothetical protein